MKSVLISGRQVVHNQKGWTMFFGKVVTDGGEALGILRPDGRTGGELILSLLLGLNGFCSSQGAKNPALEWFPKLDYDPDEPICIIVHPLLQAMYSGDWEYDEDEYVFFLKRNPGFVTGEEEFKKELRRFKNTCVKLEHLIHATEKLLQRMKAIDLPANDSWYHPIQSIIEFEALSQTLRLLKERGGDLARIEYY